VSTGADATTQRPDKAFSWIEGAAHRRERAGLTRTLRPRQPAEVSSLNLASNDYLRLSRHPAVLEAATKAVRAWGGGATGARLVTGTTALHAELEQELADFCGAEAALVFSSGYMANLGVTTALCRPGTVIVADQHNHASLIDGYALSGAAVHTVPHCDVDAVERAVVAAASRRALVITESVFSVDGDLADLPSVADVARRHGAGLLIDDAHGFGVLGPAGRGSAYDAQLSSAPDVVVTLTLSKAAGSQGGVVLGPRAVIDHVLNNARPFLFDSGLAPACAGAALAAVRLMRREPERTASLRRVAARLVAGLRDAGLAVGDAKGAVISVGAPSAEAAVAWAEACRARGVVVAAFRPPSVPDRRSRLRMSVHAELSEADADRVLDVVTATQPSTGR
jgi:8-amino-7-oxononanoate synthase